MPLAAKIREQLINSFRAELTEHIQTMTDGLLALEQNTIAGEERQEVLENIFRAAHSLKGAARAVGVTVVEQLAHALESVLARLQRADIDPVPELFTACYQALDAIQAVQAAYESGEVSPPPQALKALTDLEGLRSDEEDERESQAQPAPAPKLDASLAAPPAPPQTPETEPAPIAAAAPPGSPGGTDETIRVGVSKLDALMAQLSELLVTKIRAEQRTDQVRELQEHMSLWQREWMSVRSSYGRLIRQEDGGNGRAEFWKDVGSLLNYVNVNQQKVRELSGLIGDLARQYANDTMQMSLVIDELEQDIKRVRMLPFNTITGPFGRMVRDLAQAAGKEAVLQVIGGETELDKHVLEQIKDPLTHLLRNAVDHGVESPQKRKAAGKPTRGTITLAAEQMGKDVVICVSDDGQGLDTEAIRSVVARQRRTDAQAMTDAELAEAMFNLGISTSPIITDISGRGVGLDVVRRNVEVLHGRIDVDWTPGAGATFTLTLPSRLTSSRALMVRVSREVFAIPLNAIERIRNVSPQDVSPLEGRDTILHNGRPLTLVWLSDVLELPRINDRPDETSVPVVILAAVERRMAFAVDALVSEEEIVVKALGRQLSRVGGIAGGTVMGRGEVVLILNVADLIKLAMRRDHHAVIDVPSRAAPAEITRIQQRILIVDDSITTRTLEKNILEAAGYTVLLATDGQEALSTILTEGAPDLIVSDVAMPRIDGFGLTKKVKENPETAQVPIILVTSLDSAEHKAQGIEAGADAYIVKSRFDQSNLLETIEQLI